MELRRQLSVVLRWSWLIALSAIGIAALVYAISARQPKTYDAQTTLIVGQSLSAVSLDYNALLASQRLSQTYATVATTRPILERVVQLVGPDITVEELQGRVSAVAPRDSTLITITAGDSDPIRAARIANEIANELIAASTAIQGRQQSVQEFVDHQVTTTQTDITNTQAAIDQLLAISAPTDDDVLQLQALQGRLATLRSSYALLLGFTSDSGGNTLTLIEPAIPPDSPSSPRILVNSILGGAVGLLLALTLVFVKEYLDDTIKTGQDVEDVASLPALAFVPNVKARGERNGRCLPTVDKPRSPAAEAFRSLRTNLEFARVDAPLRCLLVTSSTPNEGKSTIAANLAVAFAQAGHRTLLIDADLRKPAVHRIFQLSNSQGITTLLRSNDVNESVIIQRTGIDNLSVLTTGPLPPNPADLLRSKRFQDLLTKLDQTADVVILDGPPLSGLADAAILSKMVDGTLLIVRGSKTRRGALGHTREVLARVDASVLGVVINRAKEPASAYYYQYYAASTVAPAPGDGAPAHVDR